MNRQPGFYWVRFAKTGILETAKWDGQVFWAIGTARTYHACDLYYISPEPIREPFVE